MACAALVVDKVGLSIAAARMRHMRSSHVQDARGVVDAAAWQHDARRLEGHEHEHLLQSQRVRHLVRNHLAEQLGHEAKANLYTQLRQSGRASRRTAARASG